MVFSPSLSVLTSVCHILAFPQFLVILSQLFIIVCFWGQSLFDTPVGFPEVAWTGIQLVHWGIPKCPYVQDTLSHAVASSSLLPGGGSWSCRAGVWWAALDPLGMCFSLLPVRGTLHVTRVVGGSLSVLSPVGSGTPPAMHGQRDGGLTASPIHIHHHSAHSACRCAQELGPPRSLPRQALLPAAGSLQPEVSLQLLLLCWEFGTVHTV